MNNRLGPRNGRVSDQNAFRIPGFLFDPRNGVLYAAAEAYTRGCITEWNPFKSIVLKTSHDGGITFGNLTVAADPAKLWPRADNSSLWDPTLVAGGAPGELLPMAVHIVNIGIFTSAVFGVPPQRIPGLLVRYGLDLTT